ncbi:MAG: ATP-binding protein [Gammaproteobacteria bacterium]|nr:ATP-binding protein [Gammaproteobacteria bacterium]
MKLKSYSPCYPGIAGKPPPARKIKKVILFGDFVEELPKCDEYLSIGFASSSAPLKHRWENNGLSADFIVDYFKMFFVGKQTQRQADMDSIRNLWDSIKYTANELLENAMKFQDDAVDYSAEISFSLYDEQLVFCVTNGIGAQQMERLQIFIRKLEAGEPQQLYFEAISAGARDWKGISSGLGLLSMICDHSAKLGWKFRTFDTRPERTTVSTMARLNAYRTKG